MKTNINPREWEAISAYLDGQLAPRDRARLEARIRTDATLRAALEELRQTRALLRSQPRIRAPRNFTLTPAMAGIGVQRAPAPRRPFATFRLASALATVMFLVVLIADLFSGAPLGPTPQMEPARIALASEAAPQAAADSMAQEAPAGGASLQKSNENGLAATETPEVAALTAPLPAPTQAAAAPMGAAQVEASPAPQLTATPQPSLVPTQAELFATLSTATPAPAEVGISAAPPSAANETGPEAATREGQTELEQPGQILTRATLRWLEAGLALVAVAAGVVAFLLRRSSRAG